MIARFTHSASAPFFRRLLAAGSIALVLLLTVLAASPELHERIHGQVDHDDDDGCAVVLFASGVTLAVGVVALLPSAAVWHQQARSAIREIFLASPRYLHQPER